MRDFKQFFNALNSGQQQRFAEETGYSLRYFHAHLIAPANRRRIPKKDGMNRLMRICQLKRWQERGAPSESEILEYFFQQGTKSSPSCTGQIEPSEDFLSSSKSVKKNDANAVITE